MSRKKALEEKQWHEEKTDLAHQIVEHTHHITELTHEGYVVLRDEGVIEAARLLDLAATLAVTRGWVLQGGHVVTGYSLAQALKDAEKQKKIDALKRMEEKTSGSSDDRVTITSTVTKTTTMATTTTTTTKATADDEIEADAEPAKYNASESKTARLARLKKAERLAAAAAVGVGVDEAKENDDGVEVDGEQEIPEAVATEVGLVDLITDPLSVMSMFFGEGDRPLTRDEADDFVGAAQMREELGTNPGEDGLFFGHESKKGEGDDEGEKVVDVDDILNNLDAEATEEERKDDLLKELEADNQREADADAKKPPKPPAACCLVS